MHDLYNLKEMLCEELETYGRSKELSPSSLEMIDKLAHAAKNVSKIIECSEAEQYSGRNSMRGGSYRDGGYSRDGYYYDDGMSNGNSYRRGRAANGRFVSRDGSEMARRLREMMEEAPDDNARREIQRLADRMEQM